MSSRERIGARGTTGRLLGLAFRVRSKPRSFGRWAFGVHAAALIATPLRRRGNRAGLASIVVTGLAGSTVSAVARRWGRPRSAVVTATLAAATLGIEKLGTSTGFPFGRYHYNTELQPQIGGVPVIVPFAWLAMAVPAREAARAISPRWRIPLGAALLTGWDLFLDPQMVGEGYWTWERGGRYRDVPFSNYVGWFATSLAVMASLEILLPVDGSPDHALVGEYAWMAVMETVGFAAFFNDRLVAAVGGTAMLPPAALAVLRTLRP
jgi:uncharacterized membrane protein